MPEETKPLFTWKSSYGITWRHLVNESGAAKCAVKSFGNIWEPDTDKDKCKRCKHYENDPDCTPAE
ncbi:hypothetical protein SAMN02745166_01051 [Prosthecobacter debontii]|uniref:Uncharacterized protein n=1 Tax=Prosthecobacter debontii TaxID=48467 RepID=A0A1T4X554_9BACT|nr:hypothetical protein [Prosthecobacter debontii]SKA84722.1 hypothetical protein SAMN02745166_01051 [Prosthecobacter debontii]